MPKNSAPTRATILAAAVQTLQHDGIEGFTLEGVARRSGVVKGLLLYHFGSRSRLLRAAAGRIAAQREEALQRALGKRGSVAGLDACWEELRRQAEDGTARAWLGLCAAGLVDRGGHVEGFEGAARAAVLDGCAAALLSGVPLQDARDAYDALWLSLLDALSGGGGAGRRA
jgi:AcrR family transcriptional regulator